MPERIQLAIDPELSSLCHKLTPEEEELLEESLRTSGCREPIRCWAIDGKLPSECPIIDGHNRYHICRKHNIDYQVVPMRFQDRKAAIEWIVRTQLGRRNASEIQKAHLRGKLHRERLEVKQAEAPVLRKKRTDVAEKVAKETGVTKARVYRDSAFAEAVERLAEKSPALRDAALSHAIYKRDVYVLADADAEKIREIENMPQKVWRACAHRVAKSILADKKKPSEQAVLPDSRGVTTSDALAKLESAIGKVTRSNSDALTDCGGRGQAWALEHHERIRHLLNELFDEVEAWKKHEATRREAA